MTKRKNYVFVGSYLSEYYEVEVIDQGGNSYVYKVKDETGNLYALKLINDDISTEKLKRFKNEIRFGINSSHPNVLKIIDNGYIELEAKKRMFYVMPLFDCNLRELMTENIPFEERMFYYNQILEGMKYFHSKGNYHRDLKPENILIDRKAKRAVIADFGISHFNEDYVYTVVETKINSKLANFQYAAPEQRERGVLVNHKADIYALGLILNEIFTNKVPYGTDYKRISSTSNDYAFLDEVVSEMIKQNPSDRIDSVEKVQFEISSRIAIHNQNKELQKIKSIEITQSEEKDELLIDPPELVNFNYDDSSYILTLELSKIVNAKWQSCMTKNSYGTIGSYDPEIFAFSGNKATVRLRNPNDVNSLQTIIDYFKSWVVNANKNYPNLIKEERERYVREQSAKLAQEIERKSKVVSALEKIKI